MLGARVGRARAAPLAAAVPSTPSSPSAPSTPPGSSPKGDAEPLTYDAARRILGATKALRCTFDEASRFAFESSQRTGGAETWTITVDAIDLARGRARVVTSTVAVNAQLVALNPGGLQILEEASGGNVFLTTVFPAGLRSKSGEVAFPAARSSHLVFPPGSQVGSTEVKGAFARTPLAVSLTGACVPLAAD